MNQPNVPPVVSAADASASRATRFEAARAELRTATERLSIGCLAVAPSNPTLTHAPNRV